MKQTEASHSLFGTGSLNNAIGMTLFRDSFNEVLIDQPVFIGSRIYTSIDILVDPLKRKIDLIIDNCELLIGEIPVAIISEKCYASALGVHREKSEADQARFSFISMASIETSAEGESNQIKCRITLCGEGRKICDDPTQCDSSSGYKYTLDGK